MRIALTIHALLILLASTAFTVVTSPISGTPFQWSYYSYASRSGFGTAYVSDYSLAVILTYLAAFVFGVVGFGIAFRAGRIVAGIVGFLLSVIGLISFTLELSHIFVDHHRSWIAIAPVAMLVLAAVAFFPVRDDSHEEVALPAT